MNDEHDNPSAPSSTPSRKRKRYVNEDITIGEVTVRPGQRRRIELPVARLPTQTQLNLPVEVVNGVKPGPTLWLSAAIHGDELNGMEIIHRLLQKTGPKRLTGTIIAVPVVNVFGFIQQDRYLPDRRDLNRCFPGSEEGSLASRLAHLFMTQVVGRCTHGIDLHTASHHRTNLPQVRGNLRSKETRRIAEAFAAPVMIHGESPPGSLREVCAKRRIPCIVYEAGEPHRFNPEAIDQGVKGVLRVMSELGMRSARRTPARRQSMEVTGRTWVRAPRGGILRLHAKLGQWVSKGQVLGVLHDTFGAERTDVISPAGGLVIGHTNHPLVNQGDAIMHLAKDVITHPV